MTEKTEKAETQGRDTNLKSLGDKKTSVDIGAKLVNKGVISPDQLEIAKKEQRKGGKATLGTILVKMGFVTEGALGEILSESTGIKKLDLNSIIIDQRLVRRVPKSFAVQNKLIPVSYSKDTITVAIADVFDIIAIDQLKRFFPSNFKIRSVYAPESAILHSIDQYYEYEMSIDGILKEIESGGVSSTNESELMSDNYQSPLVRLVDALLTDAVRMGASDIHFEPESFFLRLRYRVDGKMEQIRSFHKDYYPAIVTRLKIMSGMNIAESRKPQDGRINSTIMGRNIDFRVSSQPTVEGENFVLRILDEKSAILTLDKLGFSDRVEKIVKKCIRKPEGVVILTGPTGCGKTTTLYTILNHINTIDRNIMTLEDPVEYRLSLIRQSNIKPQAGWGFGDGVRTLLRQDPDVILVGEVRDEDTATTAVQAAMTGHQVFTSLHTNDAISAIPRLVHMGVKPFLLSGALICIIAQRLARKLCPYCKAKQPLNNEDKMILGDKAAGVEEIYKAVGCDKCRNSGYKGRMAITEILDIDRNIDELIATTATKNQIFDYAKTQGFTSMQEDGVEKVLAGLLDVNELTRVIDMTEMMTVE